MTTKTDKREFFLRQPLSLICHNKEMLNSTISARLFPRCWFFIVWHRGSEMVDFYHSRLSFRLLQPSPRGMSERLQRDANALLYIINRNLTSLYHFSIIYQKTDSRLTDWPRETANSNRIENVRRENPEFTMANLGKTAMWNDRSRRKQVYSYSSRKRTQKW